MIVTTKDQLEEIREIYSGYDSFAFDVETKGPYSLDPTRNEVFWLSLAGPGRADCIPMGHPLGHIVSWDIPMRKDGTGPLKNRKPIPVYGPVPEQLWIGDVMDRLKCVFFSDQRKIGHNTKFDLCSLAKYYDGNLPVGPYGDTLVLAHTVNENHFGGYHGPYSLGSCVSREFGFKYDKTTGKAPETHPFNVTGQYAIFDAKYTWLLHRTLELDLDDQGLRDLYEMEMQVLGVVCRMELHGVDIDTEAIRRVDVELRRQINEVYARVQAAAGWDINLNANAQVARLVYDIRGHKPWMFTDVTKEPSTAAKAFEPYLNDPVVADIAEWNDLHKLHSTYVQGLIPLLNEGRLHANHKQAGTRTGRFSCAEPNLQNIPIRQSKLIRDLFVAPAHWKLVVADYSQIELRLLAHFTHDPMLIQAYVEGLDLHMLTAMRAYHTEKPTPYQRSQGKNANFAMAYGAVAQTLVARYGIKLKEAEALIRGFYETYRNVKPWSESVVVECKKNFVSVARAAQLGIDPSPPFVTTILGRRRRLPEIMWSDRRVRSGAERQAVNFKIQGSAADVNKLALIRADEAFQGHPYHILLTVHDEIVALAPEAEAENAAILLREAMEGIPLDLLVPLPTDIKIVDRWSEAK